MKARCILFVCFMQFALRLSIARVHLQDLSGEEIINGSNHRGCAYLHCKTGEVCIHRKFRCKNTPCPSMLYCAKSRTESLRGPSTCDTVQCTNGYICMLKVRRCHWDNKCEQQIARCVSLKEYHEGPPSCAGFKCSRGNRCILRESFCANPPCKLLRSCSKNKDVQLWFAKCQSFGCPSEYQCFLRKPEINCLKPPCKHTPDCITTKENEIINEHCQGWVCPRMLMCAAEVAEPCETDNCNIKRTCYKIPIVSSNNSSSLFSRRSLKNENQVPRINTEGSRNKFEDSGAKETETPHLWLNHFNSETELDAVELWIKNSEGQQEFKQFQDWLLSIKDILGSDAYDGWLEEILSSRGEEFRKWLLNSEEPIFPEEGQPHAVLENLYPVRNTPLDATLLDVENEEIKEIETLVKEGDSMNILRKILVPNKILLPPYTTSVTTFLNSLGESNRSSLPNYLPSYPFYMRKQLLPLPLSKTENTYDQSYLIVPVKNIKKLAKEMQNQRETVAGNNKGQRNLLPNTEEPLSVEQEWHEDFEKKLIEEEMHSIQDSAGPSDALKNELQIDKAHLNDIPINLLEELLRSMRSSIENDSQTFDGKPIEEYHEDFNFIESPYT